MKLNLEDSLDVKTLIELIQKAFADIESNVDSEEGKNYFNKYVGLLPKESETCYAILSTLISRAHTKMVDKCLAQMMNSNDDMLSIDKRAFIQNLKSSIRNHEGIQPSSICSALVKVSYVCFT